MGEFEFIQRYTRLALNRQGLALEEKANGECIFLEGQDCSVQRVKPTQCQAFPSGWNFEGFEAICQAVAREVSPEAYQRLTRGEEPQG